MITSCHWHPQSEILASLCTIASHGSSYDSLSRKLYVSAKCNKANKCFFLVKRNTAHSLPPTQRLNLYKSLVVPIFSYSSAAWDASKGDMVIIERVQRRCTKWILGYQDVFYADRFTRLNILPVSLHLQIADVLLLSSIMSGKYDFNWHEFVKVHIHRIIRSSDRLLFELPSIRLEVQRNHFWYRVPR